MQVDPLAEAIAWLEKANADLEPELLTSQAARNRLAAYARAEKLAAFGRTVISRKIDDADVLARATGTSVGKAKQVVETAKALKDAEVVAEAFAGGVISLDQAKRRGNRSLCPAERGNAPQPGTYGRALTSKQR